jgi:hypothetical protein
MMNAETEMDRRMRKRDDAVQRTIAGEALLIPVKGKLADLQKLFALNPVAEFIWQRLDGTRTLADVADAITAEFDVGAEEARADLDGFVRELIEADLVEEVLAGSGDTGEAT